MTGSSWLAGSRWRGLVLRGSDWFWLAPAGSGWLWLTLASSAWINHNALRRFGAKTVQAHYSDSLRSSKWPLRGQFEEREKVGRILLNDTRA